MISGIRGPSKCHNHGIHRFKVLSSIEGYSAHGVPYRAWGDAWSLPSVARTLEHDRRLIPSQRKKESWQGAEYSDIWD